MEKKRKILWLCRFIGSICVMNLNILNPELGERVAVVCFRVYCSVSLMIGAFVLMDIVWRLFLKMLVGATRADEIANTTPDHYSWG